MKIQCDVCEKAPATVICCADEAALCGKCDVEVHAANKLASKHQRLLLQSLSTKLPSCDICQEKTAFIFCVEDRALFCKDCDEPIHAAGTPAANHQRFLATGILVGLAAPCTEDSQTITSLDRPPPHPNHNHNHNHNHRQPPAPLQKQKQQQQQQEQDQQQLVPSFASSWPVDDDLLRFSDFESSEKKEQLEFGEFDWINDMGLFGDQEPHEALAVAEVPQLPMSHSSSTTFYRPPKANMPAYKKARIEFSDDDEEFFTVPDLGRARTYLNYTKPRLYDGT